VRRANAVLIPIAIAAAGYWWLHSGPTLPAGFAAGNGRLEADEVDIDTKFAGRILELHVDEGDLVKTGQVLAVMDTRDLQAQLEQSQQLVLEAQHTATRNVAKSVQAGQYAVRQPRSGRKA
jgi:HlyD family secretion protein